MQYNSWGVTSRNKESWKFTLIADIQSQIHCKYLNLHIFDMSAPRDILSRNLCNMNLQMLNRNNYFSGKSGTSSRARTTMEHQTPLAPDALAHSWGLPTLTTIHKLTLMSNNNYFKCFVYSNICNCFYHVIIKLNMNCTRDFHIMGRQSKIYIGSWFHHIGKPGLIIWCFIEVWKRGDSPPLWNIIIFFLQWGLPWQRVWYTF